MVSSFESVDKAVAAFNECVEFLKYCGGACGVYQLLEVFRQRAAGMLHLFSHFGLSLFEVFKGFGEGRALLGAEALKQLVKDGAVNPPLAVEVKDEDKERVACNDDERGCENAAQE